MSSNSVPGASALNDADYALLQQIVGEGQLLADLAFADIVFWARTADGSFVAAAHLRPSSSATLFYRDVVGTKPRAEWQGLIERAYDTKLIVDSSHPDWFEQTPARTRAVPVNRRTRSGGTDLDRPPLAVVTRHSNLSESRMPSRLELTFNECANDLFRMIFGGKFS